MLKLSMKKLGTPETDIPSAPGTGGAAKAGATVGGCDPPAGAEDCPSPTDVS